VSALEKPVPVCCDLILWPPRLLLTRRRVSQGQEIVGEPLPLDKFPFFLFGKDRRIADVPIDHPSCSRQHAVICFRCGDGDPATPEAVRGFTPGPLAGASEHAAPRAL